MGLLSRKSAKLCTKSLALCSLISSLVGTPIVNAASYIESYDPCWSVSFNYTGDVQTFTVPTTGYYGFELYGGQGQDYNGHTGGQGGYVKSVLYLNEGDKLYINVGGGQGNTFNGGGIGTSNGTATSNGGGATDVRLNSNKIADRVIVAGGGGGASADQNGHPGGVQVI